MKKITQFISFTLFAFGISNAQQIDFELVVPPGILELSSLDEVSYSSITFADVDGDSDEDVLITGLGLDDVTRISKLYTNDGTGFYTEVTSTPFVGVSSGSIAFADIDGDADQDVLITGWDGTNQISKLYTNDGTGIFTEITSTPFVEVSSGSVAFADIDSDGDQDVLITGWTGSSRISKLYTNDGTGVFMEITSTSFVEVSASSIAFADVDGDTDQDVLITGYDGANQVSKLYTNDGAGVFTVVINTPFTGVAGSSIAFADIDGDTDQDVLITGWTGSSRISKLYTNDGTGVFTEITNTSFVGVNGSSIAFADIDGDTDQDILITGYDGVNRISKLYTNDGTGVFVEVAGLPFTGVSRSSIAFADIDGDTDQDVLITGYNGVNGISKLYINDGFGVFTEVTGEPFTGVNQSSIAFADIDGDADLDVLITGKTTLSSNSAISKLYTNDGTGIYTEVTGTSFAGVYKSSIAFADIDGDADQDVLITGTDGTIVISKLYTNDGFGVFTEVTGEPFTGVYQSSIAFADIDGDADLDILITGKTTLFSNSAISKLYTNDGTGIYTEVTETPFTGVYRSSISFADIDGDADQDVLIAGLSGSDRTSKLYTNDGTGLYTEVTSTPFIGISQGSIAFADIDGDVDPDLLITGYNGSNRIFKLYTNDGSGAFTQAVDPPFTGVNGGSIAFADVDGDVDPDLLITGYDGGNGISKLYINDGSGIFMEVIDVPFVGVSSSSIAFADIDGDMDQDVLITGWDGFNPRSFLYRNVTCLSSIDLNISVNGFTLKADQGSGAYQWLTCPDFEPVSGATAQDYLAVANGEYAVQISYNNCVDTTACFEISGIGIEQLDQALFTILPNPFDEQIKIDFSEGITTGEVRLVNALGQTVKQDNINNKELIIETKEVASGSYFLILNLDGELKTVKLIKE